MTVKLRSIKPYKILSQVRYSVTNSSGTIVVSMHVLSLSQSQVNNQFLSYFNLSSNVKKEFKLYNKIYWICFNLVWQTMSYWWTYVIGYLSLSLSLYLFLGHVSLSSLCPYASLLFLTLCLCVFPSLWQAVSFSVIYLSISFFSLSLSIYLCLYISFSFALYLCFSFTLELVAH